uniref:PPIase cyclophilin-type domain-containing protein n=1 Tax=Meloidogyne javanica TaxID=6303 RepID=A0A915M4I4_MELJA
MSVTLHTTAGNIKIELFCEKCPKSIQSGDPTNRGSGGQSIWGAPFEDEFYEDIKPSLDLKYTAFGKVIDGFDTLEELENTKVDSKYRPVVEHRIRNITIHANPIADAHAAEER